MSRKRHLVKAKFEQNKDGSIREAKEPVRTAHSAEGIMENIKDKIPQDAMRAMGAPGGGTVHTKRRGVYIRTLPVAWGLPLDEVLFAQWFSHFLDLRPMPWDDIITSQSTYLPNARNIIHDSFLSKSRCEWLVMLDSDVIPPPDFLVRLLAYHNADSSKLMIGGWYKRKSPLTEPVVYDDAHELDPLTGAPGYKIRTEAGTGLEAVDAAGAGCWLMHRSVAEGLGISPYDMSGGGEDLLLCRKVHDAGFQIWIAWDINCAHAGVALA